MSRLFPMVPRAELERALKLLKHRARHPELLDAINRVGDKLLDSLVAGADFQDDDCIGQIEIVNLPSGHEGWVQICNDGTWVAFIDDGNGRLIDRVVVDARERACV